MIKTILHDLRELAELSNFEWFLVIAHWSFIYLRRKLLKSWVWKVAYGKPSRGRLLLLFAVIVTQFSGCTPQNDPSFDLYIGLAIGLTFRFLVAVHDAIRNMDGGIIREASSSRQGLTN